MASETETMGLTGWIQTIAIGRRPKRTLLRLGLIIALALVPYITLRFIILPVRITGPSMYPTYQNGEINFVNRLAYARHEPQRGDVVGIGFSGFQVMYVKRIVGLPGETIAFMRGVIYINNHPLDEPYLRFANGEWNSPPRQLGPQEYYVVGDNRTMPFEYHSKGGTERRRIVGRILLRGES